MPPLLTIASALSGLFSLAGHCQSVTGAMLLSRFFKHSQSLPPDSIPKEGKWPGITVLKPLHGDEPLLEDAIETFFQQDYPTYQLVFGVQRLHDPALSVIQRLKKRYPHHHVSIVINTTEHGPNRKIGNLINMQSSCQHDIFVISDSDIHVAPDYLKKIIASLTTPKTELVTTLYAGLPACSRLIRQLGAHSINANFLPGVMMSRLMGRQDCLGATMALRKKTLHKIGGFEALVAHVADDAMLGQFIRGIGGRITLASTLCLTTVSETSFLDLFKHELRWGRTVRSVEPVGYGLSALQLPLFWGSLCVLFTPHAWMAWILFLTGWIIRGIITLYINRLTKCPLPGIFPLLVLRDWMSALIMVGSATGSRVAWRGQTIHITPSKNRPTPYNNSTTHTASTHTPGGAGVDRPDINRSVRS